MAVVEISGVEKQEDVTEGMVINRSWRGRGRSEVQGKGGRGVVVFAAAWFY